MKCLSYIEEVRCLKVNGFSSGDPRLTTTPKGSFIGTLGTLLQSDVVEESRIPKLTLPAAIPARKIKIGTSDILLTLQEAVNCAPRFRRPMVI